MSYELLKSRKQGIFFADELHTRASMEKPRKPLSPPGLVYCHKKGTLESHEKKKTKEGWSIATRRGREKVIKRKRPRKAGLSPQKGDVRNSRKREEKKKTKEGKKVAPAKTRFRVPYTKNSFFWSTSIRA